jgi:hypothetical protein
LASVPTDEQGERGPLSVAFSPCGRHLITGHNDGAVKLFDGTPLAETPAFQALAGVD